MRGPSIGRGPRFLLAGGKNAAPCRHLGFGGAQSVASARLARRRTLQAVLLFFGVAALGGASTLLQLPTRPGSAFWLASGLAIAVLIRTARTRWPLLLLATGAAHYLVFAWAGRSSVGLWPYAVWAIAACAEVLIAASVVRSFFGTRVHLGKLRPTLVIWASAAILGPLVGGLVVAPTSLVIPVGPADVFFGWLRSHGAANAVVVPLLLTWWAPVWARPRSSEAIGTLTAALLVGAFYVLAFDVRSEALRLLLFAFGTFPLLAWMGARHGVRGATTTALTISLVAVVQTLLNRGPFSLVGSRDVELLTVQGFVALVTLAALVAGALAEEARRAATSRSILLDTANILVESSPLSVRLQRLVHRLVPRLARAAAIHFTSGDGTTRLALAGDERYHQALEDPNPETLRAAGCRVLSLPIAAEGTGQLRLALPQRGLDPEWRALARAVAHRIGAAVETEALRTQNERRVQELEETVARLDTVMRGAPFGFAFLGRDLRLVQVSGALAQLAEREPGEIQDERLTRVVPEAVSVALLADLHRVLDGGDPVIGKEIRVPGDPERYLLASAYPVSISGGRPIGLGLLLVDITARRIAEAERTRLYREAQEAIRLRDDFLSIVSHELKTPLTPLSVRLQMLRRQAAAGRSIAREDVDRALASLDRLTALINDLLDASRAQAQRLALHFEPMSLTSIVESLGATWANASESHRVRTRLAEEEVRVRGDERRIEQVISNLIENAIKYTPGGGTILVSLDRRGDQAIVSVADPGIGIPGDQQRLLFDRFFRARNVSPHSYGGLGLGLYISRDIIERHGGRIWVESVPGEGSTFFVALPILETVETREQAPPPIA